MLVRIMHAARLLHYKTSTVWTGGEKSADYGTNRGGLVTDLLDGQVDAAGFKEIFLALGE